VIIILWSML